MDRKSLPAVGLAVLAACSAPHPKQDVSAPAQVTIEAGKTFPDLVLPSLADGKPASLAQYQGKKTLLHVFASW